MDEVEIQPDVRAFLDAMRGSAMLTLERMTPVQARAAMAQYRTAAQPANVSVELIKDAACAGPGGEIRLRMYDPRLVRGPAPSIVYFHGGGFVLGDLDSHHGVCCEIACATRLPLIAVDYRLAPEHRFPAAPDDALAAASWIAGAGAEALGLQTTALILAGDSAGANLAAVTARALHVAPVSIPVALQFLIYPATGSGQATDSRTSFRDGFFLTDAMLQWFERLYGGRSGDARYDLSSFSQSGTPPTLLVTAGLDPLRDEGREYAACLVKAGVQLMFWEARGTIHGFFSLGDAIPSAAAEVRLILTALREMIAAHAHDAGGGETVAAR